MKVMLIFPPQFNFTTPSLALPCLTAALREAGHEVIQKDVNVESYNTLLSKEELERAYEFICTRRKNFLFSGTDLRELDRLVKKREFLMNEVENAKKVLKDPESFYDYKRYIASVNILNECLQFISLAYYRASLSLDYFKTTYSCYSTEQMLNAVRDELSNPYIDFYAKHTISSIVSEAPQVIGISISVDTQVIPAFTLAYMVKQALKDAYVVVGGSYFNTLKESIENNHRLFTLFDSVILYEGETALTELVNRLERGESLSTVPNLIYKQGSQIVANNIVHIENINELPTPDFDGMPLNLYLSPKLILPIYASRGCYWGKCAFCNFCVTMGGKYRTRGEKKVRQDMEKLAQKYGCKVFAFADEALSPATLRSLSDEIIENNLDINWFTFARFEKQLDRELCNKIARAGCKVLTFGLESACDRVLGLMDKGVDCSTMKKVLSDSSEAGIANYVSLIFGFPTETFEEAKETVKFIFDNINNICSITSYHFELCKHSKVYLSPHTYSVTNIFQKEDNDLALIYNYEVGQGLIQEEVQYGSGLFLQVLAELKRYFINYHVVLYLIHYRTNDLLWITANDEERLLGKETLRVQRLKKAKDKAASFGLL